MHPLVEDALGGSGPDEGSRVVIAVCDLAIDRLFQRLDTGESAAPKGLGGQLGEPALHEIERGGGRGNEVEVKTLPAPEPAPDDRMLVSLVARGG